MSYTVVTTRIDRQMKKEAQKTAEALGMPLSVVIKAFLKQFIRTKRVNFNVYDEEPSNYLLESLKKSEKDVKTGKIIAFDSGKDALDYLDTEMENGKKNKN